MSSLSRDAVESALRSIVADLDYDLHKQVEEDEETGEDHYPALAREFIRLYERPAAE
jgi:hypothetical protein